MKAQARKESSLEIHGLPGAEETTERPQLQAAHPDVRRGFQATAREIRGYTTVFNQHSISARAGSDTCVREALLRKRARQTLELERQDNPPNVRPRAWCC